MFFLDHLKKLPRLHLRKKKVGVLQEKIVILASRLQSFRQQVSKRRRLQILNLGTEITKVPLPRENPVALGNLYPSRPVALGYPTLITGKEIRILSEPHIQTVVLGLLT